MSDDEVLGVDVHGPMPEATARAIAEAEGLTLVPMPGSISGWKGVSPTAYGRYKINVIGGRAYDSVFGAALAYARFRGRKRSAEEARTADEDAVRAQKKWASRKASKAKQEAIQPALTAEEALAAARDEGLILEEYADPPQTHGATPYVGVTKGAAQGRPYRAKLKVEGVMRCIGSYVTMEEAALDLARYRRKNGIVHKCYTKVQYLSKRQVEEGQSTVEIAPPTAEEVRASAEAAIAAAEAEGLELKRSERNNSLSGFLCVTRAQSHGRDTGYFRAAGDKIGSITGRFASAEEAALAVARAMRDQAPSDLPFDDEEEAVTPSVVAAPSSRGRKRKLSTKAAENEAVAPALAAELGLTREKNKRKSRQPESESAQPVYATFAVEEGDEDDGASFEFVESVRLVMDSGIGV